jgi:hypothetical protein
MALRNLLTTIPDISNISLWDAEPNRTAEWDADQDRQGRHAIRVAITNLFDRVYHSPCPSVQPNTPGQLRIKYEPLYLDDNGGYDENRHFFKPRTLAWFNGRPVDIHNIPTQRRVARTEQQWSAPERGYCGDYSEAKAIALGFIAEFGKYERVTMNGDYTLDDLSGWDDRYVCRCHARIYAYY